MPTPLDKTALDQLFLTARTHRAWQKRPVPDELLRWLYDIFRMGPTSSNSCPARMVFVKSQAAKIKLQPALDEDNRVKSMTAPVTAIIAFDMKFYEKMGQLLPHAPDAHNQFTKDEQATYTAALRNGTLQGAYLIIAARALGLDCGPMSGFNNQQVDELFFSGTHIKSNFICNLGYGDPARLRPRGPRLEFSEACSIV